MTPHLSRGGAPEDSPEAICLRILGTHIRDLQDARDQALAAAERARAERSDAERRLDVIREALARFVPLLRRGELTAQDIAATRRLVNGPLPDGEAVA